MDLLLQAALRLFVSQGYRSSNLEQISGAAARTASSTARYSECAMTGCSVAKAMTTG
jgi:hypothetical protein